MSSRTLAGSVALLVALAAPAAAQAVPEIDDLKPCYVTAKEKGEPPQREPMQIVARGFTPNSTVDLTIDGAPFPGSTGLQTDTAGGLPIPPVPAPFVKSGRRTFTVTLTEVGNPANTVSATAESAALDVTLKPPSARPSQRIRFKGLGFTEDTPIYAHYVRKGKLRKTVRMARRPGECGGFKVRRRQFPMKNPDLGRWTVQFDQSKQLVDPDVTRINFVRLDIRLRLVRR